MAATLLASAAYARPRAISRRQGQLAVRAKPTAATRSIVLCRAKLAEAEVNSAKAEKKHKKEEEEEEFEGEDGLSPQQVESLLTVLCEETEIAEVNLKMGGFKLHVRRSVSGSTPAAAAAPAPAAPAAPAPAPAAPAPTPAAQSVTFEESEEEDDGSMLSVTATKVGILRRGRYIKGKQVGKGAIANPGDQVKKGQVIAYVEQLGTHWPVESPQAGELLEFLLEEGDPVEYGQAVAEMAPHFGFQAGYKG